MVLPLLLLATLSQTANHPRVVVDRLFDAYRALDADGLVAVLAPHITFEDPTMRLRANGHAEMRKMAAGIKAGYRDIKIEVHKMIVDGSEIAAEVTISGTMTKPDGTTRQVRVRGASFFVVRNGLIERWTDYFDARSFMEQTR
ncbi:MAG TPA: nuclear transport factor 2 family protein [Vicinamibacterales bacterium]|nr:nuclear transport factor 2 family protein [Vicinamibacterales bacterium]